MLNSLTEIYHKNIQINRDWGNRLILFTCSMFFSFILNAEIDSAPRFKDTLKTGQNVLVFQNNTNKNKCIVQLINRNENFYQVKSAIIYFDSSTNFSRLNYRFFDSLMTEKK